MSVSLVSVQTSNTASAAILGAAVCAGIASLGAHLLNLPIGPKGGALFGAAEALVQVPLRALTTRLLNTMDPRASTTSKILAVVIHILGGLAAAWGSLMLAGFPLTLAHTISLGAVSLFFSAPTVFIMNPMGWGPTLETC